MKKSKLMKENLQLFEKLDAAGQKIKTLEDQLKSADAKFEEQAGKIAALQAQIEEMKKRETAVASAAPCEEAKPAASGLVTVSETSASPEIAAQPETLPPEQIPVGFSPVLEECLSYAAEVIGQIVIESAKYSDKLASSGKPEYIELVNLILGKTEVSKADILSAARKDCPFEERKSSIDAVKKATLEYFESVMAQRN